MENKINVAELLKNCEKGMELYSPIFGELKFNEVNAINNRILVVQQNDYIAEFESDGRLINCKNGECLLFPSKDQRDWSKFDVAKPKFDITTLKPFDKVLVRDHITQIWTADLFSFFDKDRACPYVCIGHYTNQCVPYEENEHLLGTTKECDEFYKNW